MNGDMFTKTLMLQVGDETSGLDRLSAIGMELRVEEGKVLVDNVGFSSIAEKAGLDFDQEILNIQRPNKRPPKQLMFIPAIFLLVICLFFTGQGVAKNLSFTWRPDWQQLIRRIACSRISDKIATNEAPRSKKQGIHEKANKIVMRYYLRSKLCLRKFLSL